METQISFFDAPTKGTTVSSDPDRFGCCARYRACSDARRCVIADRDDSVHCAYRRKLEAGNILYGKNANGFSLEKYQEIRKRVDGLSPEARKALDDLLIEFWEYHRCTRRSLVRNLCIDELSSVGLFDFMPLKTEFPPIKEEKWSYQKFMDLVKSHPQGWPLFQQAQKIRKVQKEKPGPRTGAFLRDWLNGDGAVFRDQLAEPYRYAYIRFDTRQYSEELYEDTLAATYQHRIYPLSPFAEDGLLSAFAFEEEESRRVQLSHGYSAEEKTRRISEIEKARAARSEARRKSNRNVERGSDGTDFLAFASSDKEEERKKRETKAATAECTPISVSPETYSGIFMGAKGAYYTTLNCCECRDQTVRRFPCKHMYRLAYELGAYELEGVSSAQL